MRVFAVGFFGIKHHLSHVNQQKLFPIFSLIGFSRWGRLMMGRCGKGWCLKSWPYRGHCFRT